MTNPGYVQFCTRGNRSLVRHGSSFSSNALALWICIRSPILVISLPKREILASMIWTPFGVKQQHVVACLFLGESSQVLVLIKFDLNLS